MKINVEPFWDGSKKGQAFKLRWQDAKTGYHWEYISAPVDWNRKTATTALNLLESVYGIKRRNVKWNWV